MLHRSLAHSFNSRVASLACIHHTVFTQPPGDWYMVGFQLGAIRNDVAVFVRLVMVLFLLGVRGQRFAERWHSVTAADLQ